MPITIGISGDSATGKSTLAYLIQNRIFKDRALLLEGDSYHKWERKDKHWKYYTHLNPKANYLCKQLEDIDNLKKWNSIKKVDYNHTTGCFTENKIVYPSQYIVVNGLHTLYLKEMREKLDLKIYLDAEKNLKYFWKFHRDYLQRGYDIKDIKKSILNRQIDYKKYICPQKKYADIYIMYFDEQLIHNKIKIVNDYIPHLKMCVSFNTEINIDVLLQILSEYKIESEYIISQNQRSIIFNCNNLKNLELPIKNIVEKFMPNLVDIFNTENEVNSIEKIEKLILLYVLSVKKIKGE